MNCDLIKQTVDETLKKQLEWKFDGNGIVFDSEKYALTPWRFDIRLKEIKNLASGVKALRRNCSYKSLIATHKSADISELLFQEIDVCQWILEDKIKYVYAFSDTNRMFSIMAKTKSGILCQIEISTTLNDGTPPITKHEIVGKEGMISDRAINEQVPVEAVYLFKDTEKYPESMTDTNLSSIGLTVLENQILDNVIYILTYRTNAIDENEKNNNLRVIESIYESVRSEQKVAVKENK